MQYIKTHMFSGWWSEKIGRKPFVLMILTVALIFFLFVGIFVLAMVGLENGVAQWFAISGIEAQNVLRDALTTPAYLIVYAFAFVLSVITTALFAKRLRDIGLPGWPLAIALTIFGGFVFKETVMTSVILLILAVTPGTMFKGKLPTLTGR